MNSKLIYSTVLILSLNMIFGQMKIQIREKTWLHYSFPLKDKANFAVDRFARKKNTIVVEFLFVHENRSCKWSIETSSNSTGKNVDRSFEFGRHWTWLYRLDASNFVTSDERVCRLCFVGVAFFLNLRQFLLLFSSAEDSFFCDSSLFFGNFQFQLLSISVCSEFGC